MGQSQEGSQGESSYWEIQLGLGLGTMGTHSWARGLVILVVLLGYISCSCKFKGQEICEGAVTKELKKKVRICSGGKLKYKLKSQVKPGYPLAGGECVWYGELLCDGAVVKDLHSWWFLSKCSKSRMRVVSRSWLEVSRDTRYRNSGI